MRRLFVLTCALAAIACGSGDRGPSLIELSELGPRHLEVGDRVRVTGTGFPEGRPASITLSGELRRAGEVPRDDVALVSPAQLVSPHALEFAVTPELAAKVCGAADARHATFRGDVTVTFSPQRASGSVVTGRLSGVVLDVLPETESGQAALANDALRFSHFFGLKIAAEEAGLSVAEVEPKSRAARGGLLPGDVITELDGVVVRGLTDLIPPPNAKKSELSVRRGPERLTLFADVAGFRYNSPDTLRAPLALLGFAVGLLLVLTSRIGRWLAFLERRVIERVRETRMDGLRARIRRSLGRSLLRALGQELPESFLPYLAFIAQSGTLALFALGRGVVVSELDLLLVPAATLSALLTTAVLAGGGGGRRWSLGGGLSRALSLLLLNVPFLAFVTGLAVWAGSLRPQDVVLLQGPWPWQWAVFQSPALGFLGVACVLALVPQARAISAFHPRQRATRRERFLDLMSWVHALAVTSVVALGVLGGFQSPFSGSAAVSVGVGAALSFFKSWSLVLLVAALRFALGPVDARSVQRLTTRWLAAPSVLTLAAWLGLRRLSTGPVIGALTGALPEILCAIASVLVILGIYRLAQAYRDPASDLSVQPWL